MSGRFEGIAGTTGNLVRRFVPEAGLRGRALKLPATWTNVTDQTLLKGKFMDRVFQWLAIAAGVLSAILAAMAAYRSPELDLLALVFFGLAGGLGGYLAAWLAILLVQFLLGLAVGVAMVALVMAGVVIVIGAAIYLLS